ncbi:MAG: YXWGXW repeat-containing protein [Candidatus Hydrogenedentes bacterium]|nr:YXWGXW repeat-containing protein [Candidatus Hydrogenedentota bacterium]
MLRQLIVAIVSVFAVSVSSSAVDEIKAVSTGDGVTVLEDKDGNVRVIHEALADAPGEAIISPTAPPELRKESPPLKPAEDAVWIPGYWSYNTTTSEFDWVPGVWRRGLPDYAWHPGEWVKVGDSYVWRNGYWSTKSQSGVVVVKEAPPAAKQEVQSASPGTEYVWVPGYWDYANGTFVWRDGTWQVPSSAGLVWIPGQWVNTAAGYQFIPGHWDYPVNSRAIVIETATTDAGTAGQFFAEADVNKDGKLALSEIQKLRPKFTSEIFVNIDTDRDGLVNSQEVLDSGGKLP